MQPVAIAARVNVRPREVLLSCVFLLLTVSAAMVFSASAFHYLLVEDTHYFLKRQLLWVPTALVVMLLVYQIDYRLYQRYYGWVLVATVGLLALVLVPGIGIEVNHSRRWLPIGGGIRFQPSEIGKLAVVLSIAGFLTNDPERTQRFWRGFVPAVLGVLVVFALTLLEPDLGTSAFVIGLAGLLVLVAGMRVWYLLGSMLVFAPILAGFVWVRWEMVVHRFQGLLDPESLHQLRHSLRALGSGGWTGLGLGAGLQKLRYLPESHTDFIFAVIGEELGFVGCVGVIAIFVGLVWAGAAIAWRARDSFGFLVASGITIALGFQAAVNIAVVTASAPTKGIALPFVTFGGTGLCTTMAQIGVLLSIARVSENTEEDVAAVAMPAREERADEDGKKRSDERCESSAGRTK